MILVFMSGIPIPAWGQPKYRTFQQDQLAMPESKAGKLIGERATFVFHNNSGVTKYGLFARFTIEVTAIEDTGGFPIARLDTRRRVLIADGRAIPPGDSVSITAVFARKPTGVKVRGWAWRNSRGLKNRPRTPNSDGTTVSAGATFTVRAGVSVLLPVAVENFFIQPAASNVQRYLHAATLRPVKGLVLGVNDPMSGKGWIRISKADRKNFPHAGTPRCLDSYLGNNGQPRTFRGQVKNPRIASHDNRLLGNLHALKVALLANDAGVTEPNEIDTPPLRSLVYIDPPDERTEFHGTTLDMISRIADSALTYCGNYPPDFYEALDATLTRINAAFAGDVEAVSFKPLRIKGVRGVDETSVVQISATFSEKTGRISSPIGEPNEFGLSQNYPNPFNPATVITFSLDEPSYVTVSIFNVLGEELLKPVGGLRYDAGTHNIRIDGNPLTSGIYYYRLVAETLKGEFRQVTRNMTLIK